MQPWRRPTQPPSDLPPRRHLARTEDGRTLDVPNYTFLLDRTAALMQEELGAVRGHAPAASANELALTIANLVWDCLGAPDTARMLLRDVALDTPPPDNSVAEATAPTTSVAARISFSLALASRDAAELQTLTDILARQAEAGTGRNVPFTLATALAEAWWFLHRAPQQALRVDCNDAAPLRHFLLADCDDPTAILASADAHASSSTVQPEALFDLLAPFALDSALASQVVAIGCRALATTPWRTTALATTTHIEWLTLTELVALAALQAPQPSTTLAQVVAAQQELLAAVPHGAPYALAAHVVALAMHPAARDVASQHASAATAHALSRASAHPLAAQMSPVHVTHLLASAAAARHPSQALAEALQALAVPAELPPILRATFATLAAAIWLALAPRAAGDAPQLDAALAQLALACSAGADPLWPLVVRARCRRATRADRDALIGTSAATARWAAMLAEWRDGNTEAALAVWIQLAQMPDSPALMWDFVARLARARGDRATLTLAYQNLAQRAAPEEALIWKLACAAVDIDRNALRDAEACLAPLLAAPPSPTQVAAHLLNAVILRIEERFEELAPALERCATIAQSAAVRRALARERAALVAERSGDLDTARAMLEELLRDTPDDHETVLALATIAERDGAPAADRAAELRKRAISLAPDEASKSKLLLDLAELQRKRGDVAAARAALERARQLAPADAHVAATFANFLAAQDGLAAAQTVLHTQLARNDQTRADRIALHLATGQLLSQHRPHWRAALEAFRQALALDSSHVEALAGFSQVAMQMGEWQTLAEVYAAAPNTPMNLTVRCRALTHLERWPDLIAAKTALLRLTTRPEEKAEAADELADLHLAHSGDVATAADLLLQAQELRPTVARAEKLIAHCEATGNWRALATLLERELPQLAAGAHGKRAQTLRRLGELRCDKLDQPSEAAAAYEASLEYDPGDEVTLTALAELYERLGRDTELARILAIRAERASAPFDRAKLWAHVAELRAQKADCDGAIAAYAHSLAADGSDRAVFTALERLCYKHQRWLAAMQLYDSCIAYVHAGHPRAYRLGDLWSRKGHVNRQYLHDQRAAIACYSEAVVVDSTPDAAATALEQLAQEQGDWTPLITAYERRAAAALSGSPRQIAALRTAAQWAQRANNITAHNALMAQLATLEPADAAAADVLVEHHEQTHDARAVVQVLQNQLRHAPQDASALGLLRKLAKVAEEETRDVATAIAAYRRILAIANDDFAALDALGRIYEATEKWSDYVEVTRRQTRVTEDTAARALLYFRIGSVMEAKFGREADAMKYYQQAVRASANCLPALHGLRDIYLRREEWPRVIETLEAEVRVWQERKEQAGVFAQIGQVYAERLGDDERALHYYESAVTVDADCVPANLALFEHYFAHGQFDQCAPLLARLADRATREGDLVARAEFFRKRAKVALANSDAASAAADLVASLELQPANLATLDQLNQVARKHPRAYDFAAPLRELEKQYRKRPESAALQARLHIGNAVLAVAAGDLDAAAALFESAHELAPQDLGIVLARVDYFVDTRQWETGVAALNQFIQAPEASPAQRITALLRLADLYSEGQADAVNAARVLREVLRLAPNHEHAHYRLSGELFIQRRFGEASQALDRAINIASAPGRPLSAPALARYYYYKACIVAAAGDERAAMPHYRRASEYDPGFAPAALALARRDAETGDHDQAQTRLIDAAHVAMASGGPRAAVPLQRGLARMLLQAGERAAAIDAYRGILNVEPDNASDRVALAEIYADSDLPRAINELRKVIDRDFHHAPAYRLLATYYQRTGNALRATRVLHALTLLGFGEPADRATIEKLRDGFRPAPVKQNLTPEMRARWLTPSAVAPLLERAFASLAPKLAAQFGTWAPGQDHTDLRVADPYQLAPLVADIGALVGIRPSVLLADRVPGLVAASYTPEPTLVLDRLIVKESLEVRRFIIGYALFALTGGFAFTLAMGPRKQQELLTVLGETLRPRAERSEAAQARLEGAPPALLEQIEQSSPLREPDIATWYESLGSAAKRAGLLACDDYAAAIWAVARLAGETPSEKDETIALGAVLGGSDLLRFYLSDDYQRLRDALATAP